MDVTDDRIATPVPVSVTNWAPPAKLPCIKNTTIKTYILDSTKATGPSFVQISDYEPARCRLAIWVLDQNITILTDPPTETPNISAGLTVAPQGGLLPISSVPYEFFGPDAFWLNSLNATARVVVVKEYM